MTTNNGAGPYIGRVRGLRQGGRLSMAYGKKAAAKKSKAPMSGSGSRFNNVVSQLSRRPGSVDAKKLSTFPARRGR